VMTTITGLCLAQVQVNVVPEESASACPTLRPADGATPRGDRRAKIQKNPRRRWWWTARPAADAIVGCFSCSSNLGVRYRNLKIIFSWSAAKRVLNGVRKILGQHNRLE